MKVARARDFGLIGCRTCGLANVAAAGSCRRCGTPLAARKPASIGRTWALLLAALLLYIPANVLPVMYTSSLGTGSSSTILGGVVDFWHAGSWGIALVIFVASVAVPTVKFLVIGTLLVSSQRCSSWARLQRTQLYRAIEFIGYWSMLDVIVVALVCSLVQFQFIGTAEPRVGIVFFGLAVVLTMLAAMSFDPRLIWDAPAARRMGEG
ncbi:MAG: paraquat-inducible protein A [Proteobacteria bacterium]|nr:paraquat-inducible protein A [Pseudomonadota bacterium]